jgi:hypothetical protein
MREERWVKILTTYPLVISTPMQVGSKTMYSALKFGFLYHGTVSSAARRLTIASEPSGSIMATVGFAEVGRGRRGISAVSALP